MQEKSLIAHERNAFASQYRYSLPVPLTSFFGREQDIAAVCSLLVRPEVRLLTLLGTGGVGKTRLSLQIATRLSEDFARQVCFISLGETNDPRLVLPTIAKALGLQEMGSQPILEYVKSFLKEKDLLLLLDNVEQVAEAAPALVALLGACPELKFLVTSRAALRVSGEYVFQVSPLALPDLACLPDDIEDALQYPAITLFLERARAFLPDFMLTKENSRVIAELCVRLDGLPLAIELAVPRLKALSPQALLKRLEHRMQLLTYGVRNAPTRQQTLQNTLEWSYRLLNPEEQQLFRSLSVFVGGCTLQALEAIWRLAGYQQELVLEGVASLLDKSMLSRSLREAGEPRLFLLRILHEYGTHLLTDAGEKVSLQWAHATYYLELAEEAEPALKGPQPRRWLELLQREYSNLREAFCFLIAQGEDGTRLGAEMALRLGMALERFWIIRGHVKEGRDLLERAVKGSQGVSLSIRGRALCILATLARYQGDFAVATSAVEESLAIFRALDDPAGIAGSLYRSGYIAWMRGDSDTASAYYEESLKIAQGDQCKDTRSETLYGLASMVFFQKDVRMARLLIEESLELSRELGDQYNIASALNILGWVSLLQGDTTVARTLQEESLAACKELGDQRSIAHTIGAMGEIAYRMGDFAQACQLYKESLSIILRLDDRWVFTVYLERLARVALAQNELIWAVHLLSTAEALRQTMEVVMKPSIELDEREQVITRLRDALGEQGFAAAWDQGQVLSPQQTAHPCATQLTQTTSAQKLPAMRIRPSQSLHNDLTPRERDVLRLVAQGLTDAQVAKHLVVSPRTINFHLGSVYRKLAVSSRSAATRYAFENQMF
jgi:predicted ATPase/DNA-binding CsgD family transcriptional regulator